METLSVDHSPNRLRNVRPRVPSPQSPLSRLGLPPTCPDSCAALGPRAAWERPSWAAGSRQDKLRGSQTPCQPRPGTAASQLSPGNHSHSRMGLGAESGLRGLGKDPGFLDLTTCNGLRR